ncbi:ABC transporter substrate-binding protein [Xanthobacter oligotrophicus]|uniref:ABC transporter substrate-binding protein n=1 Tax=Xanthobacter oligotrophicus TaxID=2607286 RepID=A0ABW6ZWD8_9HYPH
MNRRENLKLLAGAASAALLPAGRVSAAAAPVRITLPSPGSAGSVWQPLVSRLGIAEALGLNLEWIVADPGKMQTQLTAGALDVGVYGSVGLSTIVNKGSDIVLFGPALDNNTRWVVRGDSPYKTPKDLAGKTVASTPETSETYQQAKIAASLAGLDFNDLKIVFGSPLANLALFERGDVEAILTLEPTATRLVARGARDLARVADEWERGTGLKGAPILVGLAASRTWLDANRETAAKVSKLFVTVNSAIRENPRLLVDVARDIGIKPDETEALALLPGRAQGSYATAWDEEVFKVIDKQIEVAVKLGLLKQAPAGKIYVKV